MLAAVKRIDLAAKGELATVERAPAGNTVLAREAGR